MAASCVPLEQAFYVKNATALFVVAQVSVAQLVLVGFFLQPIDIAILHLGRNELHIEQFKDMDLAYPHNLPAAEARCVIDQTPSL
jgi:hypothetical protein